MAKKKLKVIPIYRFFQIMDLPSKIAFGIAFAALAAFCVGTLLATDQPDRWSLEVVEIPAKTSETVPLADYESNYRTMTADVKAWTEDVAFAARPIVPQENLVYLYLIGMVLGWSLLLTASTYVRNWVAYLLYLPFALFLLVGEVLQGVVPEGAEILASGGQLLLALVPAFMLQQKYFKLKFPLRLLVMTVAVGLPYLITGDQLGWEALHESTAKSYFVGIFLVIVTIFFLANDLNNILLYATTNAKKVKYRAQPPITLGIFLVLLGLQFMMLQDAMGWDLVELPGDFPFRPMHLVALSALVMVGTKQNMYPVLKNYINNKGLSFGLLGLGLITMSFLFYHAALGEYLFIMTIERLSIILIFLTSIFHLFYIYFNFGSLLRNRVNFYYISMIPRRLLYVFVVMATFLAGFALEASRGFTSRRTLSSTFYNRTADVELVKGNYDQAAVWYRTSVGVAEGTVKGNYNLGMLYWTGGGDKSKAREHLYMAGKFVPFTYGHLNLGQLELEEGLVDQARYFLRKGQEKVVSPYIHNNLAQVFLILDEPDSAIIELKAALQLDPDNSSLYGNLGKIYMNYDRLEEAADFFQAGLSVAEPSALTVTNALYLDLAYDSDLNVSDSLVRLPQVRTHLPAWFNLAISRFRKRDFTAARGVIDSLEAQLDRTLPDSLRGTYRPPEVQFLDGCLMFHEGKVLESVSRMRALDTDYPEFRPFTMHFLGAAYHGAGAPEMAAEFYRTSQENGREDDLINEALMEIDRGNQEYGYQLLVRARSIKPEWFDLVSKEEAMLLYARGEYFTASLGYDLSKLTRTDWLKTGIYAGQIKQQGPALEAFRRMIAMDSSTVLPYLEMGKISLQLGDSLAIENLEPGLAIDPNNGPLKVELARAYLQQNQPNKAQQLAQELKQISPRPEGFALLNAELALEKGDTAQAVQQLKQLYAENPLQREPIVHLVQVYRAQGNNFDAHDLLMEARTMNSRQSAFEYQLAFIEKQFGRIEESATAAERAIMLEPDSARSAAIGEEFQRIFELRELGEEAILQELYNLEE